LSSIVSKIFSLKTLKYVLITISAFLLIGIIGYFSLRNYILQKAVAKVKSKVENTTYLTFNTKGAKFTSLNTVQLTNISLVPTNRDTLFTTDTITVSVKLLPALFGSVRLSDLQVSNTVINLRKDSLQTNFRALLKPRKKQSDNTDTKSDYSKKVFRYIKRLLAYLPDAVTVNNAKVKLKYNDSFRHITLQKLDWQNDNFEAVITPQKEFGNSNWLATGFFDKDDIKGELELTSNEGINLYFASLFKSGLRFKKLHLTVDELDYQDKKIVFKGKGNIDTLAIYNSKIAKDTVVFYKAGGEVLANLTRQFINIDSSSLFKVNSIAFNTTAQYPLGKEKLYSLQVKMPSTPAQNFFSSLPQGMFKTFSGIKVKGNLSYHLNCFIDGAMPDSLQFESKLQKEDFRVVKFGAINFTKINESFTHTVFEKGKPLRTIEVGDTNPYFTPLEEVNPHFVNALLINEDPSFFRHRGFIPQSFRDAIAAVYKADGKFVRGGSTISMQLVKNAFLERRKTVARKAEEALIVWLIENNRLCTKERMFEVYVNIIEFAPNIYGIGEATRFYFSKKPADLTLAEGIYLSNIIPRPKAFKYGFEKDGTMKYWLQEKANLVVRRMVQREQLPASDSTNFSPQVQLNGEAKYFINPIDSFYSSPPQQFDFPQYE
jgi:hypothetical protein